MINLSSLRNFLNRIKNFFFHPKQLADAIPSHFNVVEEYFYNNITVAKTSSLQLNPQQPKGYIEIIVPNKEWKKVDAPTRTIHNIEFSPGHSNLLASINENLLLTSNNLFTIQHVLYKARENYRTSTTRQQSDLQSYRIELQYTPEIPKISLVSMTAKIYDEPIIERDLPPIDEEVPHPITKHNTFFNFLRLQLQFKLILPKRFELPPNALCITEMSLQWPVITSTNQFRFSIWPTDINPNSSNDSDQTSWHEITYDPATKSLFLGQIGFEGSEGSANESICKYQTPFICLDIFTSSDLYKDDYKEFHHINGNAIIKIPKLLSGLEFLNLQDGERESNASSEDQGVVKKMIAEKIPFEEWSKIHIKFNIKADRLFERRHFSPYQYLEFPNVILNEMRLVDISRLLQDMQFNVKEIDRQYTNRDNKTPRYVLLEASRPQGAQTFHLRLVVEGNGSRTTRRKEIPGNEQYTSAFPTGNMKIYIQGEIEGDRHQSVQIITDIHNKLKNLLKYVTVIE